MGLFTHILAPTDGSALSQGAAEKAIELARSMGARLTFFHATPERTQSHFGGEGGGFVNQMSPEQMTRQSQLLATAHLGQLEAAAFAAGVQAGREVVLESAPAEAIIDAAQRLGCDLIVMASHGRRGLKGLIIGSETQKVLTHSKIPVLVFR